MSKQLCAVCRRPREIHGYQDGEPICRECVSQLVTEVNQLLMLEQS